MVNFPAPSHQGLQLFRRAQSQQFIVPILKACLADGPRILRIAIVGLAQRYDVDPRDLWLGQGNRIAQN